MGVLGSQNSGQVASRDVVSCLWVMAGAEGGQAVRSLARSPFLCFCASFCSSRWVYSYTSWICYLPKLCGCTSRKKTWLLNPCFQEPYLGSFVQQKQKCWVYPLFVLRFAGTLLAITLVSIDDLSTEILASLYLENNKRCIRWKN